MLFLSFRIRRRVEVAALTASADRGVTDSVPSSTGDLRSNYSIIPFSPAHGPFWKGPFIGSIINIYYNLSKRLVDCVVKLLVKLTYKDTYSKVYNII